MAFSDPPASSNKTLTDLSSDRRDATTDPADPAPTVSDLISIYFPMTSLKISQNVMVIMMRIWFGIRLVHQDDVRDEIDEFEREKR